MNDAEFLTIKSIANVSRVHRVQTLMQAIIDDVDRTFEHNTTWHGLPLLITWGVCGEFHSVHSVKVLKSDGQPEWELDFDEALISDEQFEEWFRLAEEV